MAALVALLVGGAVVRPALAQPAEASTGAVLSTDEQLAFLRDARVVSTRPIGKGVTGALRVELSDGRLTHDAAFQRIAQEPTFDGRLRAGELRFADHYRYNVAAWRLAVQLGLGHMMPPTIEREIGGAPGALSWWLDDVLMDEAERDARSVQPPDPRDFARQRQRMSLFAELVRDTDRNRGNVLYTRDWRVVMIDFTRAFRLEASLRAPAQLTTCDRAVLAALRTLTRPAVEGAAGRWLTVGEITALLKRRDLLVAHVDRLIAERGEQAVLY